MSEVRRGTGAMKGRKYRGRGVLENAKATKGRIGKFQVHPQLQELVILPSPKFS